ncbi:MAG TPA: hypothetical protein VJT31_31080 [Rugosimonospora sp.]|nr:hypothetical protein [Rugosimonospora sp.]
MEHQASSPTPITGPAFSRRRLLTTSGALAGALASIELLDRLSFVPQRMALTADAAAAAPSDVQVDVDAFIPPAQTVDGVQVRFGPVHTLFATAQLDFLPVASDQTRLENALRTIESVYPWSPSGVFTHVAYGGPYWNAFPLSLSTAAIPRLTDGSGRFVQAPAVPGPTDVHPNNPSITKQRFNVRVQMESNVMLFTIRSDVLSNATDVANWLAGSNRLRGQSVASPRFTSTTMTFTSLRHMFVQAGLPRQVADQQGYTFASVVNPKSTMWMSFLDQQTSGSAAASRVTFAGSGLTDGTAGRYLDNGTIQHLSHVIQDLHQFYDVDEAVDGNGNPVFGTDAEFTEKVQYMFHAPPVAQPDPGNNLTGPAVLPNDFRGTGYAAQTAQGIGTDVDPATGQPERRVGHLSALQRSSRDARGGPLHLRLDGPGFDSFDMNQSGVPARFQNKSHPKLQFSVFVPSAAFFEDMRRNQASLDLQQRFGSNPDDNGLERFITATRRQNFLVPPRRHRSFPLVELL